MKTVLIKYNAGNIRSVGFALDRLGIRYSVSDDPDEIRGADKVIFPGVGHAASAMQFLQNNGLDTIIPQLEQPFLGICLGMQLMCRMSEEGPVQCLGVFPEPVLPFPTTVGKVPHMGWNTISHMKGPLFNGLGNESWAYFVHSYFIPASPNAVCITNYGGLEFASGVQHKNFWGVQFHPERSGTTGMKILENFFKL